MKDQRDSVGSVDTFESAYAELQEVLDRLQVGGLGLEAAVALFEQGMALADRCEKIVTDAEMRVTRLAPESAAILANGSEDPAF